jgi:suppressor for copper-sensitivity B
MTPRERAGLSLRRFLAATVRVMKKQRCLPVAVFGAALILVLGPAEAVVGPWVSDGKARVRLIAAGIDASGQLRGGLEIALDPGWHTYWRSPGDSGIAPTIDFSGSRNLGPVAVAFPVPERLDDGYSITNIYKDSVILPLTARLIDPAAGADLSLKLDIGVCAEVCMPDHFEAAISVKPGQNDPEAGEAIAAAEKRLPGAPDPGAFAVTGAARQGGTEKRPTYDVAVKLPDVKGAEVFVEGPADWYPNVPKLVSEGGGSGTYRVTFDRITSKVPIAGTKLRVTIVSGGRAIEQWVLLD